MDEQPGTSHQSNNGNETQLVKRALTRLSLNLYQNKSNNRELFEYDEPEKNLENSNNPELDAFEAHSIKEDSEWEALIKNIKRTRAEQKPPKVDINMLTSEQLEYLKQAPNWFAFVNGSLDFQYAGDIYLNKHVVELVDITTNLIQTCERQIKKQKAMALNENLANLSSDAEDKP